MTGALPRTTTVSTWARRLVAAIPAEVRADLAENPETAIQLHFPLIVREATSLQTRGAGGWCDGMSFIESGVILYRRTGSRRHNFTVLHELGHYLVAGDIACLSWLADQPSTSKLLEQICSLVAAELLIPPERLAVALADGPPSAEAFIRLYEDCTQASRSACATALAQKLPCEGFVVLAEEGSTSIFYGARLGDTRPYGWAGDVIPLGHPLRVQPPPARGLAWWPEPVGSGRREYFMSAGAERGWVFAIFAENNLWRVPGFHLPQQRDAQRRYEGTVSCATCGYQGATPWFPCSRCQRSPCPQCEECECQRRERRERRATCRRCMTSVREHLLQDGLCDGCR